MEYAGVLASMSQREELTEPDSAGAGTVVRLFTDLLAGLLISPTSLLTMGCESQTVGEILNLSVFDPGTHCRVDHNKLSSKLPQIQTW